FGIHRRWAERRGVVHVVVHADEAWDYGTTCEIENFRAVGCLCRCGIACRDDFSVADYNGLIRACGGARTVDHANMGENDCRGVFKNEWLYGGAEAVGTLSNCESRKESADQE